MTDQADTQGPSTAQTILIVDDAMDMRIFLSTLFKSGGYRPLMARNGRQGLEMARAERPDLIVLDVMMPEQGGALMYQGLKSDPALCRIPVIMLSAVGRQSFLYYLKMFNARCATPIAEPDRYLEKPPEPDDLLAAAAQLLAS